ncbi:ATP-grasp domain-containing protein [Methylophilus aquaticus]|uniref:ATP-grasp domain-containing protein n=1 Tax=Methylophilus aquaticus TaxID=1971610 RepID=A0ABT9JVN0_9PROT|nr:ATP-grasp domain-containing protein [Methylophilus aquaticus]MDP8568651.1 ATP-grasp domain-containing protein [Methylophilus aquaticus]
MQLAVVSQSARIYANFAHEAGLAPDVIDAFADIDTRACANRWLQCKALVSGWNPSDFRILIDRLDAWQTDTLVIGSGFEQALPQYAWLYQHYTLAGNTPQVMDQLKDPFWLAPICTNLGIASPEVRQTAPVSGRWLVKQRGGCGGGHIKDWQAGMMVAQHEYYQAWQAGISVGALFVGNGEHCRLVGVHQLHEALDSYAYAGASRLLDASLDQAMQALADCLMQAVALKGIFSIDARWHAGRLYLLEVNPRLSASMRLYVGLPLMQAHLAGCRQQALPILNVSIYSASHRILYAGQSVDVSGLRMPDWLEDRPNGGMIEAGQPVCSLYAQGENMFEVQQQLLQQQEFLKKLWGTYVSERIQFFND